MWMFEIRQAVDSGGLLSIAGPWRGISVIILRSGFMSDESVQVLLNSAKG